MYHVWLNLRSHCLGLEFAIKLDLGLSATRAEGNNAAICHAKGQHVTRLELGGDNITTMYVAGGKGREHWYTQSEMTLQR